MFRISDYDERQRKTYPAYQFDNGDDYVEDGMQRIIDENGRIGYADESGRTVITPRFKCAFPFENGKAKVADYGEIKEVPGSGGNIIIGKAMDGITSTKQDGKSNNDGGVTSPVDSMVFV